MYTNLLDAQFKEEKQDLVASARSYQEDDEDVQNGFIEHESL